MLKLHFLFSAVILVTMPILAQFTDRPLVLELQAEDSEYYMPTTSVSDTQADFGKYLTIPSGSSNISSGRINFNIDVPTAGSYALYLRNLAPSTSNRQIDFQINYATTHTLNLPVQTDWKWSEVVPTSQSNHIFELKAGLNIISFTPRHAGLSLDSLVIVRGPNYLSAGCLENRTETIYIETESPQSIVAPLAIQQDPTARHGQKISVPDGTANHAGSMTYTFRVRKTGDYLFCGRSIAPHSGANSIWVDVDDQPTFTWVPPGSASWLWYRVRSWDPSTGTALITLPLTAGEHTIVLRNREDGTQFDTLLLTNNPSFSYPADEPLAPVFGARDGNFLGGQQSSATGKMRTFFASTPQSSNCGALDQIDWYQVIRPANSAAVVSATMQSAASINLTSETQNQFLTWQLDSPLTQQQLQSRMTWSWRHKNTGLYWNGTDWQSEPLFAPVHSGPIPVASQPAASLNSDKRIVALCSGLFYPSSFWLDRSMNLEITLKDAIGGQSHSVTNGTFDLQINGWFDVLKVPNYSTQTYDLDIYQNTTTPFSIALEIDGDSANIDPNALAWRWVHPASGLAFDGTNWVPQSSVDHELISGGQGFWAQFSADTNHISGTLQPQLWQAFFAQPEAFEKLQIQLKYQAQLGGNGFVFTESIQNARFQYARPPKVTNVQGTGTVSVPRPQITFDLPQGTQAAVGILAPDGTWLNPNWQQNLSAAGQFTPGVDLEPHQTYEVHIVSNNGRSNFQTAMQNLTFQPPSLTFPVSRTAEPSSLLDPTTDNVDRPLITWDAVQNATNYYIGFLDPKGQWHEPDWRTHEINATQYRPRTPLLPAQEYQVYLIAANSWERTSPVKLQSYNFAAQQVPPTSASTVPTEEFTTGSDPDLFVYQWPEDPSTTEARHSSRPPAISTTIEGSYPDLNDVHQLRFRFYSSETGKHWDGENWQDHEVWIGRNAQGQQVPESSGPFFEIAYQQIGVGEKSYGASNWYLETLDTNTRRVHSDFYFFMWIFDFKKVPEFLFNNPGHIRVDYGYVTNNPIDQTTQYHSFNSGFALDLMERLWISEHLISSDIEQDTIVFGQQSDELSLDFTFTNLGPNFEDREYFITLYSEDENQFWDGISWKSLADKGPAWPINELWPGATASWNRGSPNIEMNLTLDLSTNRLEFFNDANLKTIRLLIYASNYVFTPPDDIIYAKPILYYNLRNAPSVELIHDEQTYQTGLTIENYLNASRNPNDIPRRHSSKITPERTMQGTHITSSVSNPNTALLQSDLGVSFRIYEVNTNGTNTTYSPVATLGQPVPLNTFNDPVLLSEQASNLANWFNSLEGLSRLLVNGQTYALTAFLTNRSANLDPENDPNQWPILWYPYNADLFTRINNNKISLLRSASDDIGSHSHQFTFQDRHQIELLTTSINVGNNNRPAHLLAHLNGNSRELSFYVNDDDDRSGIRAATVPEKLRFTPNESDSQSHHNQIYAVRMEMYQVGGTTVIDDGDGNPNNDEVIITPDALIDTQQGARVYTGNASNPWTSLPTTEIDLANASGGYQYSPEETYRLDIILTDFFGLEQIKKVDFGSIRDPLKDLAVDFYLGDTGNEAKLYELRSNVDINDPDYCYGHNIELNRFKIYNQATNRTIPSVSVTFTGSYHHRTPHSYTSTSVENYTEEVATNHEGIPPTGIYWGNMPPTVWACVERAYKMIAPFPLNGNLVEVKDLYSGAVVPQTDPNSYSFDINYYQNVDQIDTWRLNNPVEVDPYPCPSCQPRDTGTIQDNIVIANDISNDSSPTWSDYDWKFYTNRGFIWPHSPDPFYIKAPSNSTLESYFYKSSDFEVHLSLCLVTNNGADTECYGEILPISSFLGTSGWHSNQWYTVNLANSLDLSSRAPGSLGYWLWEQAGGTSLNDPQGFPNQIDTLYLKVILKRISDQTTTHESVDNAAPIDSWVWEPVTNLDASSIAWQNITTDSALIDPGSNQVWSQSYPYQIYDQSNAVLSILDPARFKVRWRDGSSRSWDGQNWVTGTDHWHNFGPTNTTDPFFRKQSINVSPQGPRVFSITIDHDDFPAGFLSETQSRQIYLDLSYHNPTNQQVVETPATAQAFVTLSLHSDTTNDPTESGVSNIVTPKNFRSGAIPGQVKLANYHDNTGPDWLLERMMEAAELLVLEADTRNKGDLYWVIGTQSDGPNSISSRTDYIWDVEGNPTDPNQNFSTLNLPDDVWTWIKVPFDPATDDPRILVYIHVYDDAFEDPASRIVNFNSRRTVGFTKTEPNTWHQTDPDHPSRLRFFNQFYKYADPHEGNDKHQWLYVMTIPRSVVKSIKSAPFTANANSFNLNGNGLLGSQYIKNNTTSSSSNRLISVNYFDKAASRKMYNLTQVDQLGYLETSQSYPTHLPQTPFNGAQVYVAAPQHLDVFGRPVKTGLPFIARNATALDQIQGTSTKSAREIAFDRAQAYWNSTSTAGQTRTDSKAWSEIYYERDPAKGRPMVQTGLGSAFLQTATDGSSDYVFNQTRMYYFAVPAPEIEGRTLYHLHQGTFGTHTGGMLSGVLTVDPDGNIAVAFSRDPEEDPIIAITNPHPNLLEHWGFKLSDTAPDQNAFDGSTIYLLDKSAYETRANNPSRTDTSLVNFREIDITGRALFTYPPRAVNVELDNNSTWRITFTEHAPSLRTAFEYDQYGNVIRMVEADAGTTLFVYDDEGRVRLHQAQENRMGSTFDTTNIKNIWIETIYDVMSRPIVQKPIRQNGHDIWTDPSALRQYLNQNAALVEGTHYDDFATGLDSSEIILANRDFTTYTLYDRYPTSQNMQLPETDGWDITSDTPLPSTADLIEDYPFAQSVPFYFGDPNGLLTERYNNDLLERFYYDHRGNVACKVIFNRGFGLQTIWAKYNEQDQLEEQYYHEAKQHQGFRYDAWGNLVEVVDLNPLSVRMHLLVAHQAVEETDDGPAIISQADRAQVYLGPLLKESDFAPPFFTATNVEETFATFTYDTNGNLMQSTLGAGDYFQQAQQTYEYDIRGLLVDHHTDIKPRGRTSYPFMTFKLNYFDNNPLRTPGTPEDTNYRLRWGGNVTEMREQFHQFSKSGDVGVAYEQHKQFHYDEIGQLTYAGTWEDNSGNQTAFSYEYAYDKHGNRKWERHNNVPFEAPGGSVGLENATYSHEIDPSSNRLKTITSITHESSNNTPASPRFALSSYNYSNAGTQDSPIYASSVGRIQRNLSNNTVEHIHMFYHQPMFTTRPNHVSHQKDGQNINYDYYYDASGNRVEEVIKQNGTKDKKYYLPWGNDNLAEFDISGRIQRVYIMFGDQRIGYKSKDSHGVYLKDHLGSTRAVLDLQANPAETQGTGPGGQTHVDNIAFSLAASDSSPFGITQRRLMRAGADAEPHQFTGQEEMDYGLYNYGARMYDPIGGRFLSEDPAREFHNSYSYVGNNPIMVTDPTGENGVGALIAAGNLLKAKEVFTEFSRDQFKFDPNRQFTWNVGGIYLGAYEVKAHEAGFTMEYILAARNYKVHRGGTGTLNIDTFQDGHNNVLYKENADVRRGKNNLIFALEIILLRRAVKPVPNRIRFTPIVRGPLAENVMKTFRGGTYDMVRLRRDTTLYRVYGGEAGQIGSYWTRTKPSGPLQSRLDSALLPEWGNTATNVVQIRVPRGTIIYEGAAAPQVSGTGHTLLGGGSQVYIPRVHSQWIVK